LADVLGAALVDGDDLHPQANVDKMAAGEPLDDDDRGPWNDRLVAELQRRDARGERVVLACSALRRAHRERLVGAVAGTVVVHLQVSADELARRLALREGHFMPATLLPSQLEALEAPEAEHAVVVDGDQPVEAVVGEIVSRWAD
jgi:carbohydrate kinase (thermoresistant glucokinase family)